MLLRSQAIRIKNNHQGLCLPVGKAGVTDDAHFMYLLFSVLYNVQFMITVAHLIFKNIIKIILNNAFDAFSDHF